MNRKRQISTPQGVKTPEPILMKLGMVDYVRDLTTLVGVTLRGWSGHIRDLSNFRVPRLFSFFFWLSSPCAQVAFLDLSGRSIRQNAFPAKDVSFGGLDNI